MAARAGLAKPEAPAMAMDKVLLNPALAAMPGVAVRRGSAFGIAPDLTFIRTRDAAATRVGQLPVSGSGNRMMIGS